MRQVFVSHDLTRTLAIVKDSILS